MSGASHDALHAEILYHLTQLTLYLVITKTKKLYV